MGYPAGSRRDGFTLVELMVVVTVVGILSAIVLPRFVEAVRRSREGAAKGDLGAVRSALKIYYADMEGQYPVTLASLTQSGKYLESLPDLRVPDYHPRTSLVQAGGFSDSGGWTYDNAPGNATFGAVWVDCTHTDSRGSEWTSY